MCRSNDSFAIAPRAFAVVLSRHLGLFSSSVSAREIHTRFFSRMFCAMFALHVGCGGKEMTTRELRVSAPNAILHAWEKRGSGELILMVQGGPDLGVSYVEP